MLSYEYPSLGPSDFYPSPDGPSARETHIQVHRNYAWTLPSPEM